MLVKLFYNFVFLIFGIFYFPFFLLRLKQEKEKKRLLLERYGYFSAEFLHRLKGKTVLWIHAVSVGEVFAAWPLVESLKKSLASAHWIVAISTVTPTGQAVARRLFPNDPVFYFPFDLSGAVRRTLSKIHPSLILLMETEIWPNLILGAWQARIPVGLVNGRLSPKSHRRYLEIRPFLKGILEKISFFLVQFQWDSDRLQEIGVKSSAIEITGNMKFDMDPGLSDSEVKFWKAKFFPTGGEKVLLGGSTHEGEEEVLMNVFRKLRFEFPNLKLILAPRHVTRAGKLARWVEENHFHYQLASLNKEARVEDVLILDTMGELKKWYALADYVFVGGSLVKHGGQNPIEAAVFKRPILFGPHVFNFQMIYQALLDQKGGVQVYNETELYEFLRRMLVEPSFGNQLGSQAFELVRKLQGATQRNVDFIRRFLKETKSDWVDTEVSMAR